MTNKIKMIFDNSDLHIQENIDPKFVKFFFGLNDEGGEENPIPPRHPDEISIILDDSDLLLDENLDPDNLIIYFGQPDLIPCDNLWDEVDGDQINLDCNCLENWHEVDGDQINLDLDCSSGIICDNKWDPIPPGVGVDFNCACPNEYLDSNDFIIECSDGEQTTTDLGRFVINANGENVKFEIHGLEIYRSTGGETAGFALEINRTEFNRFDVYQGEQIPKFEFYRERILGFNALGFGEIVSPNVLFAPVAYLDFEASSGESSNAILSTEYSLVSDIRESGESVNLQINTYPSASLEISVDKNGENVSFAIVTSRLFKSVIGIGEDSEFELTKPYNPDIEVIIDVGENAELDLSLTQALDFRTFYVGDNASLTLSVIPSLNLNEIHIGEESNVTFYESQLAKFTSQSEMGENLAQLQLITSSGFIVNSEMGESTNFDVEYDPYTGFPLEVLTGENVEFELYRNRLIYPDNIQIGESVSSSFNIYPAALLSLNSEMGERVDIKLVADIRLGNFNAIQGESTKLNINELENYKVIQGESAEFTLSTESLIIFESEMGEVVSFDFKPGLPQYLSFNIKNGEHGNLVELRTLIAIDFRVVFSAGERVYMNDWSNEPFHIDLDDRKCCDWITGDLRHVELDDAPHNWTSYDFESNACEMLIFELSTRRAFEFEALAGETLNYDNTLNVFEFDAIEGQYCYVPSLRTLMTTDLDEGNIEQENPVIDIDRPDISPDLKYIVSKMGEYTDFKLGIPYALNTNLSNSGESMSVVVTFNPPFRFDSLGGEHVTAVVNTNIQVPVRYTAGESMNVSLYEDPYLAASGESVEIILETKSDYYAEFITDGCLENQYQDIDPDSGQPLPQEFEGTNVEGEMFMTYVEGRCF